jgi:hypothetical protein
MKCTFLCVFHIKKLIEITEYITVQNTTIYQHSDKNTQYQFTLRQHVSAASRPSSGQYRTYKMVQQSEHSMGSHFVFQ